MNKHFPWGVVASLLVIVAVSVGGGYLLYRIIDGASPLRVEKAPAIKPPEKVAAVKPAPVAPAAAEGFLLVHLRSTAEMSPDTGESAFDVAIESKGFVTECSEKVVAMDHRVQKRDYWSEEEGASAEVSSLVCLPATALVAGTEFGAEASTARAVLEEEDASTFPQASVEGKGKVVFVHTGKAGFMLYAGGATAKTCESGCEAGLASGVSVMKVSRPMTEERFLFTVPVGDSKTLNVTATVPLSQ